MLSLVTKKLLIYLLLQQAELAIETEDVAKRVTSVTPCRRPPWNGSVLHLRGTCACALAARVGHDLVRVTDLKGPTGQSAGPFRVIWHGHCRHLLTTTFLLHHGLRRLPPSVDRRAEGIGSVFPRAASSHRQLNCSSRFATKRRNTPRGGELLVFRNVWMICSVVGSSALLIVTDSPPIFCRQSICPWRTNGSRPVRLSRKRATFE